jgi:hypothetical protein
LGTHIMRTVILGFGIALMIATPALATTSGTCFGIIGLSDGDKLNLRVAPYSSARIVGRFDNDSAGVIAKTGPCHAWCRVSVHTGDGSFKGWMYSRYLQRRECP